MFSLFHKCRILIRRGRKFLYVALIVILACTACSKWIPSLNLVRKIEVKDEVDSRCSFLDARENVIISQAFVPQYDEIGILKVYLDQLFAGSKGCGVSASVLDETGDCVYMKKIPAEVVKNGGWQEVVSGLLLEKGRIYYLELQSEATGDEFVNVAVTDKGRMCFWLTYREPYQQEDYISFDLMVILASAILLAYILKK